MKLLYKNIAWTILALIVLSFVFSLVADYAAEPKALSLNDLVAKINTGEVASIIVHDDTLDVTLTDKTMLTAQKESEAGLTETLKNYGVETNALRTVPITVENRTGGRFWASILIPTLLPVIAMIAIFWFIFRQAKGGQNQAFSFGKAGIKLFASDKDSVTFKDVAGLKETKQELEEIVDFLKNPKKFIDMGARIPRGGLLMGAPGTGKTLLARAVAGESNVPFFHISASEFVEMFVGVGASRTRDAFATAKKSAPSILFIDEIDAIGRQRGTGMGGGHDEREQTLNQILVEMDGF